MYVLPKQQRIAEMARRSPQMGFTSLAYLMDIDWLTAAFHRTRKDGAPGVDGQTWHEYERNLEVNLQSLLDRAMPMLSAPLGDAPHRPAQCGLPESG